MDKHRNMCPRVTYPPLALGAIPNNLLENLQKSQHNWREIKANIEKTVESILIGTLKTCKTFVRIKQKLYIDKVFAMNYREL